MPHSFQNRTMGRAFSPLILFHRKSWGSAPGWYGAALSALEKARIQDFAAILRAKGPALYQPGAKPQDFSVAAPEGLKARPIDMGFQLTAKLCGITQAAGATCDASF